MKVFVSVLVLAMAISNGAIAGTVSASEATNKSSKIKSKLVGTASKMNELVGKIKNDLEKIASTVEIQYLTDQNQESYFLIAIQLKDSGVPDFSVAVPETSTTLSIHDNGSGRTLSFVVYEKDLQVYTPYEKLSMPENRIFPINIDGKIYGTVLGHREIFGGEIMDCYLDGSKDMFGGYVSFEQAGEAINSINALKDQSKYLAFLPDLKHVSAPILYKGKLLGDVSLVGYDVHSKNSGLLIRLSPSRIKALK